MPKARIIVTLEPRPCKTCGSELVKREHESTRRFMNKRYCSAKCGREGLKKEGRGWYGAEFSKNRLFGGSL
jgi:hypothetical protein